VNVQQEAAILLKKNFGPQHLSGKLLFMGRFGFHHHQAQDINRESEKPKENGK
jgi:hypothetical protein